MSSTTFQRGSTHASLVPQIWSKKDYRFAFESNPFFRYMGTSDKAVIQVNKDFTQKQGDKVTFALRGLLTEDGQTDDGTYSGNSEAMVFYNFDVQIHERGHSTQLSGNMTEQAAYDNLRPKGQSAIREWVGMVQAADIISALSGLVTKNHIAGRVTGANATDASSNQIGTVNQVALTKSATATRWFGGGQNSSGTITRVASDSVINSTSNHLFGTKVIEYVKRMATRTVDASGNAMTPVRPIMVDGEQYYILFIDRMQFKQLKADTDWKNAQQYANIRGKTNPIFSGAEGIWDGVIVKQSDHLHRRLGAGGVTAPEYFDTTADVVTSGITVARALFCGAQACALAWGKMPVWKTGYNDPPHNTKYTVHTDFIYGVKKTVFATGAASANVEFGCIVIDTAIVAD